MADILLICIREEDKDDFTVEFIKNLMSRGLTVSYCGAFYSERKNEYIYDSVTNLLFFSSAYFREAPMKSKKNFRELEHFICNIDFEEVDAELVIFSFLCLQKIGTARLEDNILDDFVNSFLRKKKWTETIVEMIRSSCEMSFSDFKYKYQEVVEILNLDENTFTKSKNKIENGDFGTQIDWLTSEATESFDKFMEACRKVIRKEPVAEFDLFQEKIEQECNEDFSKGGQLISEFFEGENVRKIFSPLKKLFPCLGSLRRNSKKKLILYYEDLFDLYIYSKNSARKETRKDIQGEKEILPVPLGQIKLNEPRDLYSSKRIKDIIDNYVMRELHPPLVDIHFPDDVFLLETDPEEPEIGFLSTRRYRNPCETIEENLRVDVKLREKLWIYRWIKEKKSFQELKRGHRKNRKEKELIEDILVVGRIKHLYEVLIATKRYGSAYHWLRAILGLLLPAAAIYFVLSMLWTHLIRSSDEISMIPKAAAILFFSIFTFWASRDFVLKYILDPMYDMFKLFTYSFVLITLSLSWKSLEMSSIFLLIISLLFGVFFCRNYISSAVLYEINESLSIIECEDVLKIQSLDNQEDSWSKIYNCFPICLFVHRGNKNKVKGEINVRVLRCGRFHTVVKEIEERDSVMKEKNAVKIFFNSDLFPIVKYICKESACSPKEIAYSSGIHLASIKSNRTIRKLMYKKPKVRGFWRNLGNLLLGKGKIECKGNTDRFLPGTRAIYFGQWDRVMNHIRNAIPVFPQLVLFRNLIVLTVLSGLLFNFFSLYRSFFGRGISPKGFTEWVDSISFPDNIWLILYIIGPFICFLLIVRFKLKVWKVFLVLIFFYLSGFYLAQILKLAFFVILVFFMLLWFPLKQILYSIGIWGVERMRGDLISVVGNDGNQQGTGIQRNFFATRFFVYNPHDPSCQEKERVYSNEQFFEDIVFSKNWRKSRRN